MISELKCDKCEHEYKTDFDSLNYVQTEPRKDDQFQEFITYNKCPNCGHCQNYCELHTCVATSHYGGERWCGWCDRDMTPNSYYI